MQSLWVATRKGLFSLSPANGWQVGTPAFLGDPVSNVLDDGRDGSVYAALNLGHFGAKLHRSEDRGRTWRECSVPSYANVPAAPAREGALAPPEAPTGPLRRHVADLEAQTLARFEASARTAKVRRFREFFDGATSWSRVERIIARVEVGAQGADTRFIVTNLAGGRAKALY